MTLWFILLCNLLTRFVFIHTHSIVRLYKASWPSRWFIWHSICWNNSLSCLWQVCFLGYFSTFLIIFMPYWPIIWYFLHILCIFGYIIALQTIHQCKAILRSFNRLFLSLHHKCEVIIKLYVTFFFDNHPSDLQHFDVIVFWHR